MKPITTVSGNVAAFAALSDDELVERVKDLAACERRASVALIRSLVEFDAAGGAAMADNIQLRCRAHNQYEARLFFGDTFVRERQQVWVDHRRSGMIGDGLSSVTPR
jgi:hypothetical protein